MVRSLHLVISAARNASAVALLASLAERVIGSSTGQRGVKRKRGGGAGKGTAQLEELVRLLDSFGITRSSGQKRLHQGMMGSVMQRIFGTDSEANMRLAQQAHGITSSQQQFMAVTPRRFGKTTAVSMFVAAFALAVADTATVVFSTGRRASSLLLQQIKGMIMRVPGGEARIKTSNVENLILDCGGGMESKISSYPGKAQT